MKSEKVNFINPADYFSVQRHGYSDEFVQYAPNLEDFSIVVDLEVEKGFRNNSVTQRNEKYVLSWKTNTGTQGFNSGTEIPFNGNEELSVRYLTSDGIDYTYNEIKNGKRTSEMFGIESINIQYQNYHVPEVTIKFVDVRGVSVFSPEELRHSAVAAKKDGEVITDSVANNNIASSFFNCFFTYPYPIYRLLVKGPYGDPVKYELSMLTFNSDFNSGNGNYGITVKLIGYKYSLLNDVTLNSIIAAPNNLYHGVDYWNDTVSKYKLDNDTPIPKLSEIIYNLHEADIIVEKLRNDDNTSTTWGNIKISLDALKDNVREVINVINKGFANNSSIEKRSFDDASGVEIYFGFTLKEGKDGAKTVFDDKIPMNYREKKYKEINSSFENIDKQLGNSTIGSNIRTNIKYFFDHYNSGNLLLYHGAFKLYENGNLLTLKDDNSSAMNYIFNRVYKQLLEIKEEVYKDSDGKNHYWFSPLCYIYKLLSDLSGEISSEIEKVKKENEDKINQTYNDKLGFIPNIRNVTSILMAHMETFFASIAFCEEDIYRSTDRRVENVNKDVVDNTDIVLSSGNIVVPFPEIKVKNGDDKYEKTWIGDNSVNIYKPEKDLIEGLFAGLLKFGETLSNAENISELNMTAGVTDNYTGTTLIKDKYELNQNTDKKFNILYPITYFDLINIKKNNGTTPWVGLKDLTNGDELKASMKYRFNQLLPYFSKDNPSSGNTLYHKNTAAMGKIFYTKGKLDAHNFFDYYGFPEKNSAMYKYAKSIIENEMFNETGKIINSVLGKKNDVEYYPSFYEKPYTYIQFFDGKYDKTTGSCNSINFVYNDNKRYGKRELFNFIEEDYDVIKYKISLCENDDYDVIDDNKDVLGFHFPEDDCDKWWENGLKTLKFASSKNNILFDEGNFTLNNKNDLLTKDEGVDVSEKETNAKTETAIREQILTRGYNTEIFDEVGISGLYIYSDMSNNPMTTWVSQSFEYDYIPNNNSYSYKIDNIDLLLLANNSHLLDDFFEKLNIESYSNKTWIQYGESGREFYGEDGLGSKTPPSRKEKPFFLNNDCVTLPYNILLFLGKFFRSLNLKVNDANFKMHGWNDSTKTFNLYYSSQFTSTDLNIINKMVKIYDKWYEDVYKAKLLPTFGISNDNRNKVIKKIGGGVETLADLSKNIEDKKFFFDTGIDDEKFKQSYFNLVRIKKHTNKEIEGKYSGFLKWVIKFKRSQICTLTNMENSSEDNFMNMTTKNIGYNCLRFYPNPNKEEMYYLTELYLKRSVIIRNPFSLFKNDISLFKNQRADETEFGKYKNMAANYVSGFLKTAYDMIVLKENEDNLNNLDSSNPEIPLIKPTNLPEDLKVNYYYYIKTLYDKWLSGDRTESGGFIEKYTKNNFFDRKFHFIDSLYNDIGSKVILDLKTIIGEIYKSLRNETISLMEFLTTLYAENKLQFHCLPNFSDLQSEASIKRAFSVVPYNEINFNIGHNSDFVAIYTSEPSKSLDDENSEFKDDGLYLYSDEEDIVEKCKEDNTMPIPAFGVMYGQPYQHYFKEIQVGMDDSMVTEESLKNTFFIADLSQGGENGRSFNRFGQDLYTIYSNRAYKCTLQMMGSAWIQPLMYFELMNVPLFRGAYLIHRVSHSITPGNMITTITGVRQNRYTSRYIAKGYYAIDNSTNGHSNANVYNSSNNTSSTNCGYERFEPKSMIPQSSDVDFSRDIEVLKNYVGDWYNKDSSVVYNNTWEAILGTCIGEAGNQGELGVKLVATSLYLRGGKVGWKKTLVKQQFNGLGNKSPNEEKYKQIVDWVTEIFVKSPLILVGKKTDLTITNTLNNNKSVTYNPVIICEGGISTNKLSESGVEITEQMIRNLVCFVATSDNFYDNLALTTPQKKSKFFFQHGGHVFHSYTTLEQYNNQTKPYWDGNNNVVKSGDDTKTYNIAKSSKKLKSTTPSINADVTISLFTDKTKEELNLSDNAIACYRAITKTAKVVTKFDYDKNGLKVLEKSSGNTVYLSTNTNVNNSLLFDIILKTYQNECSEISWVTDGINTQNDEPICVKIVCEEKNNKVVSIINNSNQQLKLNGSLPYNIKKSLYGKYIPFTDNNEINDISKSIQNSKMLKECKIFDDNFIKDMNKVSEIFKGIVCTDCQKIASTGGKSSSNGKYEYFNQVVDLNNLIKTNRKINLIVVHTSANSPKSDDINSPDFNKSVANTEMIRKWETNNGFSDIAYHYVIERDGTIKFGRDINVAGAHTKGKNKNSIGICYVGGINKNSKATDNRTVKQKESLIKLLEKLKSMYNLTDSDIAGHYKYASKPCPCFLIPEELKK